MILYSGLDSIIESLYLDDDLTESVRDCSIVVNPDEKLSRYLMGRLIIINHKNYSVDLIRKLKDDNKVITRIDFSIRGVLFDPYILRINDNIRLSGEFIDYIDESCYNDVDFRFDGKVLYYPSPESYEDYVYNGNLTSLGYLLYQIGYNLIDNSIFKNLDVIKLKNGLII